ncbi:hypothetical protein NMG60_11007746 [Bertholletia excelsa]
MDDSSSYPTIEPTNFDLIVVGTGLPESVLAAAASAAGKTVLHLDSNSFYGGHFSSLPLDELSSFLQSQSSPSSPIPAPAPTDANFITLDLISRPLFFDVEISSHSSEPLKHSRKFNLDLGGPKVLFCADSAVNFMLKSGASQYMEFKSVDATFVFDGEGKFSSVPDSRSAIFKDATLGLAEKNRLGSFFKLVEGHLKAGDSENGERKRISEEDLESPLVEFMTKMRLSSKMKSIILYAIALADYDQDNMEVCKDVLKTKDGIDYFALYLSSVGRFPNVPGAFIYPVYGQGELPQAFCRRAAVKGSLYVLRMPVNALIIDKDDGSYKGVKVASGQELFSHQIVMGPSFKVPSSLIESLPDLPQARLKGLVMQDVQGKVARGICISNGSLKPDVSNFLVVYPPKSLYPEQVTSIRVLQIGSGLAICPSGMFVMYLSALCDEPTQGKKLLHAAVNSIFSVPISGAPENGSGDESENTTSKPALLWSALYIQELTKSAFEVTAAAPMPDGSLNYNDILESTKKLFQSLFPQEEFFPEMTLSEQDDDGGVDHTSNNDDSLE